MKQNKDMSCDKHSEQNSHCNIEKRLQIFLTSTDPTTWDVKSGTSAVTMHFTHVYQKMFWYVFCGYIKLQASVVIRKESYKSFATSLWPPHKRYAGETGGGTFHRISSWWHGLDKAVFRIRGWEAHTKMKHNVDHYYEAVLGITRRAGEVRPADFHSPRTLKNNKMYLTRLSWPVQMSCMGCRSVFILPEYSSYVKKKKQEKFHMWQGSNYLAYSWRTGNDKLH